MPNLLLVQFIYNTSGVPSNPLPTHPPVRPPPWAAFSTPHSHTTLPAVGLT